MNYAASNNPSKRLLNECEHQLQLSSNAAVFFLFLLQISLLLWLLKDAFDFIFNLYRAKDDENFANVCHTVLGDVANCVPCRFPLGCVSEGFVGREKERPTFGVQKLITKL